MMATIAKDFSEIEELRYREEQLKQRHKEVVAGTWTQMELDIQGLESLLRNDAVSSGTVLTGGGLGQAAVLREIATSAGKYST
jgi:hypothetical protein